MLSKRILSLLLCLSLLVPFASAEEYKARPFTEDAAVIGGVSLPHALVRGLKVMTGDETGSMNWESTLTRAEAATMLVRLVGAEQAAQEAKSSPSPFTDVPAWVVGYVNYAYANELVQGAGEGLFQPDRVCTAAEFLTMLYRLTDLEEGTDYTWNTAVSDFNTDVSEMPRYSANDYFDPASYNYGFALTNENFTRELAASTIFRMMNIVADHGVFAQSVADLLATRYGLSSMVFYDCYVRRTGIGMFDRPYTTSVGEGTKVTLSISEGKLYMDEPKNTELEFFITDESQDQYAISSSKPFILPKEKCQLTINYLEKDGDTSIFHTAFIHIGWADGRPGFTLYESVMLPDYAFYYAIEENGFHLRAQAKAPKWFPLGDTTDEMRALAAELVKGKGTQLEQGRAICDWVATHIYYDYDNYMDGAATPTDILTARRGVCAHYADLTQTLMTAAGLECYIEESIDHAWNAALLDGEWVLIDNTFDSPLQYRHGEYLIYDPTGPKREGVEDRFTLSHPVDDKMEPGAEAGHKYFGMWAQPFYQDTVGHSPLRDPAFYR